MNPLSSFTKNNLTNTLMNKSKVTVFSYEMLLCDCAESFILLQENAWICH